MDFSSYFLQIFTWQNLLWLIIGSVVGVILGALPGMSADTGIGIFLPLTFSLPPTTALICLGAIYVAGSYGGNITAILVNTPGTSDSLFMTLDGYPMTLRGEGLKAIGVSTISAFTGGIVGCMALLFIAPKLAKIAFFFGSWELFLTVMMGIIIIVGLVKGSAFKGLMSASIGFLCSLVGMDGITGQSRFNFGISAIYDELPLLPVVLGVFAFSQVFILIAEKRESIVIGKSSMKGSVWLSRKELLNILLETLRGAFIGTFIGIIPAAGTTVAAGLSYNMARNSDKDPDSFGKGNPKGLASVSAANNGVVGGSLVPLLTLGIPGNGTSALFLSALLIHGLAPGTQLFTDNAPQVYGLIFGLLIANVFILIFGFFGARFYAKITKVPSNVLIPLIAALCILGAFSFRYLVADMFLVLFFGLLGYFMDRLGIPMAPFVLAFVLGKSAEIDLRRAIALMTGKVSSVIFTPLSIILILIDIGLLIWPFWDNIKALFVHKAKT
ncbi:tripartite tricarboxylate transporter permease [Oscillibacter sp.]|uniref:tripartite tricarboxylate transporter permease n=1 Tax=Oscillibacter sp. TaxID=1945593 RepID=UPI003393EEA5